MILAVIAALAAFLTFISFVAPTLFGAALVTALAALLLRLVSLFMVYRLLAGAGALARRGLVVVMVGEGLLLVATIFGIPPEPHMEGSAIAGWAGLLIWACYGAACAYGGVKLAAIDGWIRFAGIAIAVSAGFWFTQIGLLVWPFTMAAGYACFALAGWRSRTPRVA